MISLEYSSDFVRKYKKLEPAFKTEIKERLREFQDVRNHQRLRVHKLHGELKGLFAFSTNYHDRIVFEWNKPKTTAYILDVGDHSIYE